MAGSDRTKDEIDSDLVADLTKNDSQESRVEALLIQIIRILKRIESNTRA